MSIDSTTNQLAGAGVAYAPAIAQAAQSHGLDPDLLAAVAAQETGGPGTSAGRNVVGDGGHGHGLFQIDDRYHAFAGSSQAMDPDKNADYAAGMLSGLLSQYGGNVHEALSAYNAGSPMATGTKTTWGDGQTLGYADSVMRHYGLIAGGGAPQPVAGNPAPQPVEGNPGPGTGDGSGEGLQESAMAELPTLIASMSALGQQAQAMPTPTLPQTQQPQSYQRQATDYTGLFDGDDG